jgi:hypothetical protein
MEQSQKTKVDCYVIFTKSDYKNWFMKYLDDRISHVYVMIKSEGEHFWQIINPKLTHLDISMKFVEDYPHPRCYAEKNAVILPVTAYIGKQPRWGPCFYTCTEVVKSLLGIKSFWIFTPKQLYDHLVKLEVAQ